MSDQVSERLIAELEAEAKLVDHGEFTMDDLAARTKLARYRLAKPGDWACLVVEAANLFGATWVDVLPTTDEVRFVFDGEPVDGNAIFSGAGSAEGVDETRSRLGLRKLAIAISTLIDQYHVVGVDIESTLGRVRVHGEGPNECSPSYERTNSLRVQGLPPEAQPDLNGRCRFSPMKIKVDYERISHGLRQWMVDRGGRGITEVIDGERTIGYVGWRAGTSPAMIQVLTHGVGTEVVNAPTWEGVAIIDVPLRKDVGERAVLRDAEFERVMALVEAAASKVVRDAPVEAKPVPKPSNPDPLDPQLFYAIVVLVILGVLFSLAVATT